MDLGTQGLLLAMRPHGESGRILTFLTPEHGKYTAFCRDTKATKALQPGTLCDLEWYARLNQQMGRWKRIDVVRFLPHTIVTTGKLALMAHTSALSLCDYLLQERDSHPEVFLALQHFIFNHLTQKNQRVHLVAGYLLFEFILLQHIGFGLDWNACALSGKTEGLTYVSPKTGRAVCSEEATPYLTKLLPLPPYLLHLVRTQTVCPQTLLKVSPDDEQCALDLMGHFVLKALDNHHTKHKSMLPITRASLYPKDTT